MQIQQESLLVRTPYCLLVRKGSNALGSRALARCSSSGLQAPDSSPKAIPIFFSTSRSSWIAKGWSKWNTYSDLQCGRSKSIEIRTYPKYECKRQALLRLTSVDILVHSPLPFFNLPPPHLHRPRGITLYRCTHITIPIDYSGNHTSRESNGLMSGVKPCSVISCVPHTHTNVHVHTCL